MLRLENAAFYEFRKKNSNDVDSIRRVSYS